MNTTCEQEPIHLLSGIQQNGTLIVISYDTFSILQISDNCSKLTLISYKKMLQKSLKDFFSDKFINRLRTTLDSLLAQKLRFGSFVESDDSKKLFCAVHCEEHFAILEISEEYDSITHLPAEETVSKAIQHYDVNTTLEAMLHTITKTVQEISGFDRVMVYQFDEDFNGTVLAQVHNLLNDNYLGHHFPASDIPPQARALYLKNPFRIIENVDETNSLIIPTLNPITHLPIDMSFCYCRSVSPVHITYLKNMGIQSSMSISLIIGGKLWGLIVCHHPTVIKIPLHLYATYHLLSSIFSSQIEQKEHLLHYERSYELRIKRELYLNSLENKSDFSFAQAIAEEIEALEKIIPCATAALYYNNSFIANTDKVSQDDLMTLLGIVKENLVENYYQSSRMGIEFPKMSQLSTKIGGIIGIQIRNIPNTYLLFIRYEQAQTITWAGEPQKQVRYENGKQVIEPRASFESWKEVVIGTSAPFLLEETDSAIFLSKQLFSLHKQFELHEESRQLKANQVLQEQKLREYQIQEAVLQERELLLNALGEGVYGIDRENKCFFINPAACSLLGFTPEEVIGKNPHELFHHHRPDGTDFPLDECFFHNISEESTRYETQDWLINKSGEMFPVQVIVTPLHKDGQLNGAVLAFNDITLQYSAENQLKELNKKLQDESVTDPLTKLYNRRYFEEYGILQFERCHREHVSLCLIAIDIDHFKHINDTYGHDGGDKILIEVAQIIKSKLRDNDILARVGGEEFTIILPETSLELCVEVAQRIKDAIAQNSVLINGQNVSCTISLGVSIYNSRKNNFSDLLIEADEKLYKAKGNGRNRIEI